ncbi:hypothetical protein ABZ639_04085 [Saccharomonospora sp. NPDC006951]
MPSAATVTRLLGQGLDYVAAAKRLGISPGTAYLIRTGVPADGGDTVAGARRELLLSHSQLLVQPNSHNPTEHAEVMAWLRDRALGDPQMQAAAWETR